VPLTAGERRLVIAPAKWTFVAPEFPSSDLISIPFRSAAKSDLPAHATGLNPSNVV